VKPLLLAFPGNEALAEELRRALEAESVSYELRRFPDGESYLRIDSDVRELGAASVGIVAPYLAYMRQDCRFRAGEAITSTSFARELSARFDWLVTVDPHLHRRSRPGEIYAIPATHVLAAAGGAMRRS
jgi:ribose-phosphate pyrophosphokinase